MMFRNAAHGGLNMIYRRGDGNVGWVDPEGNTVAAGSSQPVTPNAQDPRG
jgi:hypothetical protein